MCPMSVTRERSGTSAALYIMLDAPLKAESIDVHRESPHWSIETSLSASAWPSRRILVMSPDMRMVWSPAESYVWVWLPLVPSSIVPSPQSIVYVPRAGTVTDSPGATVLHVVTKSESLDMSLTAARTTSVDSTNPSLAVSVNASVVEASACGATNVAASKADAPTMIRTATDEGRKNRLCMVRVKIFTAIAV